MNDPGLFASPKWELMKEVSTNSQSPTSLAKKLHTSIPNVLHHLKLLEAYGIITGKPATPKTLGKPPTLYGLAKPLAFIILLDKLGSQKKNFNPTNKEKYFLKCILEFKEQESMILTKLGLEHPELLLNDSVIAINEFDTKKADLLVLHSDVSKFRSEKSKIIVSLQEDTCTFTVWSHTPEEFSQGVKNKEEYFLKRSKWKVLHDPKMFMQK